MASRARKEEIERDYDELTSRGRRNDDDEGRQGWRQEQEAGVERDVRAATRDVKTTKTTTGTRRQDGDRNKTSGRRQEQDVKTSAGAWRQDDEDDDRKATSGRRQEQDVKT